MVALLLSSFSEEESGSPRRATDVDSQQGEVLETRDSSKNTPLWSSNAKVSTKRQRCTVEKKSSILATMFIESFILVLLFVFLGLRTLSRIDELYLRPQLPSLLFETARMTQETTYYDRYCDEDDISTHNPDDVYLREDYGSKEAYNSFLTHGFTVFPNVIPKQVASGLRAFVLKQNSKQIPDENLLWSPEHRWLIEMGADESSFVRRALQHIATNKQFRGAIEQIMGPNPARKLFLCFFFN